MVHYQPPKRRSKAQRSGTYRKITDFSDEELLLITHHLTTDELRKLRATCNSIAPACLTEIQKRNRILYIHPSPSRLKAVPGACMHPFLAKVEEAILLGFVPLDKMKEKLEKDRNGKTMERKFATWPEVFPKDGKAVAQMSDVEEETRLTHDVLVESIRRLKKCKHLSYQTCIKEPGFNEIKQDNIESYSKKYMDARNNHDGRITDVQLIMDLLTDDQTAFESLSIRTPLPMAPGILYDDLPHLTTLSLALEIYSNPADTNVLWPQQHKWRKLCTSLLNVTPNLQNLTLVLTGTSKIKLVRNVLSSALRSVELFERRWPNLQNLTLRMLPDKWHTTSPQRPTCQTLGDIQSLKDFLIWHVANSKLRYVNITNILFVAVPLSILHSPTGPNAITTLLDILAILRKSDVDCEYTVNRFRHHRYCKRQANVLFDECRVDCGVYTPSYVDGGTGVEEFEDFVGEVERGEERGVEVQVCEGEWRLRWMAEGMEMGELEEGLEALMAGKES